MVHSVLLGDQSAVLTGTYGFIINLYCTHPFIVLFCLETIQGFINSHLALSVLTPKGILPVAILKNGYEKTLVITSSSFT